MTKHSKTSFFMPEKSKIFRRKQKTELVKEFSETAKNLCFFVHRKYIAFSLATSRIMNIPVEAMITIIREVESENVGTGNVLLCDRR